MFSSEGEIALQRYGIALRYIQTVLRYSAAHAEAAFDCNAVRLDLYSAEIILLGSGDDRIAQGQDLFDGIVASSAVAQDVPIVVILDSNRTDSDVIVACT